jgi:RNA polymerase sigma factor (TIGR02999 family)
MKEEHSDNITGQLQKWANGSGDAFVPEIYEELCRIARRHLKSLAPGHSMEPAEVVNEAYLRLRSSCPIAWRNRQQFYGTASRLMRLVLVDYCRRRSSRKRGGDHARVLLDDSSGLVGPRECSVLDVHEALEELASLDERQAQIVEMRFFGGLSVSQVAEALSISEATVKRDSAIASAWLKRRLTNT